MKVSVVKVVMGMYLVSLSLSLLVAEAHEDPLVQESLCVHNKYRELESQCLPPEKCLPPLTWNDTVACYARDYAQRRKCDCKMEHSNVENPALCYGENLAMSTGPGMTVTLSTEMWYNEKPDYCYETMECAPGKMCGHYTQVVWNTTLQLGCATIECDTGGSYVTCNYWPPGNYVGERPY